MTIADSALSVREQIRSNTQSGRPIITGPVAVESLRPVSDGFWRVRVRGDDLRDYREPWPADAFKLMLPPDGRGSVDPAAVALAGAGGGDAADRPALRAYTVRSAGGDWVEFDVAAHGDGLAMRWLRQAAAGCRLGLTGVRREFFAAPGVDQHLLVGDSSAAPAIAAILESLPEEAPATVLVATEHESDLALLPRRAGDDWLAAAHVSPLEAGTVLLRTLTSQPRPPGRVQAYLAGETRFVRRARQLLLDEWRIARTDLQASAYWRAGHDASQVDAAAIARYQRALQRGMDLTDPDVLDQLEFAG